MSRMVTLFMAVMKRMSLRLPSMSKAVKSRRAATLSPMLAPMSVLSFPPVSWRRLIRGTSARSVAVRLSGAMRASIVPLPWTRRFCAVNLAWAMPPAMSALRVRLSRG